MILKRISDCRGTYYWIAVLTCLILLCPQVLKAETGSRDLEQELTGATGAERLELLVKLTGLLAEDSRDKALKYGLEAQQFILTHRDDRLGVELFNHLSNIYYLKADFEQGRRHANKARSLARKIKDKKGEATALINLGNFFIYTGEYRKARDFLAEAVTISESLGDPQILAKSYFMTARLYRRLNDFSRTLDSCMKAAKIYNDTGDKRGIANTKNISGFVYWELKEYDKALAHLEEARRLFHSLNDAEGEVKVINNIGLTYSEQKKTGPAMKYLVNALELCKKNDFKPFIPSIIENIGREYSKRNDHKNALKHFHEALEISETIGRQQGVLSNLLDIGRTHRILNQYETAVKHLNRALGIAKYLDDKITLRDIYLELSIIKEAQKKHKEAFDFYEKYKEKNDEMFDLHSKKKIAEMQTTYELDKKEKEVRLMKNEERIQQLELNKHTNLLYSYIAVSFLIVILGLVIYARFRMKLKITRALKKEVDEHKRTTEKLRESEEKFRELAEKSVVGIYILQGFEVKYVNPRMLSLIDYSKGDVIGRNPLLFIHPDDREMVRDRIVERLNDPPDSNSYEFRGTTREGDVIYLESHGTRTFYQGKPAVLGTIVDITDRKNTEKELMKSMKLESIGILAGGIAHDFNNLLAIILENISTVKEDAKEETETVKMLVNVENASRQASELAQKLITFSEGGWIEPQKVTLDHLLKETADYFPRIRELALDITIAPDLKPIFGDQRQLRKVIQGLVQNADDATGERKDIRPEIALTAKNKTLPGDNSFSLPGGDYVNITIADNGGGIPHDQLEKIFNPYYSTKDTVTQKGMGLGLAICYSIIKKHKGHITVQSEIDRGTTVDIYLPAFRENY